jgi:class 3 adenylate cyclase/tetratricopeptide (TPR) repeat protein
MGAEVSVEARSITDLRRHIPRIVLEWDDIAPGQQYQQVDASLVFADISGFTALTERLAVRGRMGAEELIETLNRVFGAMLAQAAIRGGEMLKFGGDALLFVFRGDDHAMRACRSAVDMRQALREAAKIPTSVGRLKLSMSVGIHSGPVDFFLVGAPTRELLILGPAGTATAEAEHAAVAGQILITEGTAKQLPGGSTELREDGLHRLKWRFTYAPEGQGAPAPGVSDERIQTLFPNALGEYLADRVPDPEHKTATIGFARFSGTDALLKSAGPQAAATALHETISVFEDALIAEGVSLLATDLDSDGGKLFLGSGVPKSSEDDEGRMLRAMRKVIETGTPLPLQIGVNRGHVFAAEVGYVDRAAYSAMGDTTNTAARIMSKAPIGRLFAHPSVLEQSRTLFATTPSGPYEMKGKAVPVPVFEVGEELGTREVQARTSLPLVGRDAELAEMRTALDDALSGTGGVITVSAATGLGKSRLIREALKGIEATIVPLRAEPYGMTAPYRMLRDPVRNALGVERGEPADMAAALLASFERLLPDMLPLAPLLQDVANVPLPPTPEASAIEPRFRPGLISEIVVRLIEASVQGPLVVVVEEAHWADASSITVLQRIAASTAGRPWVVIAARRSDGEGFAPEAGTFVSLQPLSADVMRHLVIEATTTQPLRPHEIDEIVNRAAGNPLFVEEIIRVYREVGTLEAVPDSLQAANDAQIDALDPYSRQILRYASVLGRSFRRQVLDETLALEDLALTDSTLSNLKRFLEAEGDTRLRFRTGMIRDAAYEGLAYRQRARLHAAAGQAVEKLSTDLEADADTLSLHYWRGGDAAATWRFGRLAGDLASRAYANVDAAVQYQRALDSSRHLADVTDEERLALWLRLAAVRELAGLWDAALDALSRGAKLARGDRDTMAALILQRANTRLRATAYRQCLSEVTRAEKLLAGDDSIEARVLRVRLRAVRLAVRGGRGQLKAIIPEAKEIIEQAREVNETEALLPALTIHDIASFQLGDLTVGANLHEALRISLETGNLSRAFRAYLALAGLELYSGRWSAAVDSFYGARNTALSAGDTVGAAQASVNLSELLVSLRRFDEADEVLTDAIRVLRVAEVHEYAAYGELHRGRLLVARGHLDEAEELLKSVEQESEQLGDVATAIEASLVLAEALNRQGRPEAAIEIIELPRTKTAEDVQVRPRVHLEQARAYLVMKQAEQARAELHAGLALAREYDMAYEESRLLLLDAEISLSLGDVTASDQSLAAAREIEQRLGVVS